MSFLIVIVPFDDPTFQYNFISKILWLGPKLLGTKIIMSLPTKEHKYSAIFFVDLIAECGFCMIDLYYFVDWLKVCQVFGFMALFTSLVSWVMLVIWLCQNNKTQCLKFTILILKLFTSKFHQMSSKTFEFKDTNFERKFHIVLWKQRAFLPKIFYWAVNCWPNWRVINVRQLVSMAML